jgi:hypothetical protein
MTNTHDEGEIRLVRRSDAYWRVTFDPPPLNLFWTGEHSTTRRDRIIARIR